MVDKEIFKIHTELFYPDREELGILGKHENIKFSIISGEGLISQGRQSRVSILEYEVDNFKQKVIWKRMGAGKGLTFVEADELRLRLAPYRDEIIKCGWMVPVLFYSEVVNCGDEFQIFSYEQFIPGGDAEKMVLNPQEPNFKKWFILRKVSNIIASYPIQEIKPTEIIGREVSLMPHGLDLKLANLVLDEAGQLFFVDLFGPKELGRDNSWRNYSPKLDSLSQEKLIAICATVEGSLLRLFRLIEEKWADIGGLTSDKLRSDFIEMINSSGLSRKQVDFIRDEITDNYSWLDSIYKEESV